MEEDAHDDLEYEELLDYFCQQQIIFFLEVLYVHKIYKSCSKSHKISKLI